MRHRRLTIPCLLTVLLAAAGGCSGGSTKRAEKGASAATVPAASAEPTAVTVRAHEYGFDTPAEIEGGVVRLTLQNDGKLKHEAVVVAAGDTPLDRVRQDLTPVVKGEGNDVIQDFNAAEGDMVRLTSGYKAQHWGLGEIEVFGTGATLLPEDDSFWVRS